jgi:hypothetical protein
MELNQSAIEELAMSPAVLQQMFEDRARAEIVANAVRLLNEALLLDREGISKLLRSSEIVRDRFDHHPKFLVRDYWGDSGLTAMTAFGLINSLLGLAGGRGLIIMDVDDDTDEIIMFRARDMLELNQSTIAFLNTAAIREKYAEQLRNIANSAQPANVSGEIDAEAVKKVREKLAIERRWYDGNA